MHSGRLVNVLKWVLQSFRQSPTVVYAELNVRFTQHTSDRGVKNQSSIFMGYLVPLQK